MSSSVRWRISQSFGTASHTQDRGGDQQTKHNSTCAQFIHMNGESLSLPPHLVRWFFLLLVCSSNLHTSTWHDVNRGDLLLQLVQKKKLYYYAIFCTLRGAGVDWQWFMAQEWMVTTSYLAVRVDHWCARALLSLTCYYYCRWMDEWMTWNGVGYGKNKCRILWLVKAHVIYNCSSDHKFSTIVEGSAIRFSPEPVVHCPHHSIQYCMYCRFSKAHKPVQVFFFSSSSSFMSNRVVHSKSTARAVYEQATSRPVRAPTTTTLVGVVKCGLEVVARIWVGEALREKETHMKITSFLVAENV